MRASLLSITSIFLVLGSSGLNAGQVTAVSETDPAKVTSSLDVGCFKAFDNLEKNVSKIFGSIPFVSDARVISSSPWNESSKGDASTAYTKTLNISATPTYSKEFPTIFMPITVYKTACNPPKPNTTSTCKNTISMTISGTNAVIYQKVTEVTKSQDWAHSFSSAINLEEENSQKCNMEHTFSISGTDYLFAKKHLMQNLNQTVIEGRILSRFVGWAKTILPQMEDK